MLTEENIMNMILKIINVFCKRIDKCLLLMSSDWSMQSEKIVYYDNEVIFSFRSQHKKGGYFPTKRNHTQITINGNSGWL